MDVAAWLQSLGFGRYAHAFRDNEIDWEVLPKLTSEDLREIGVAAIGHRRKLLDAIGALGAAVPAAAVTAATPNVPAHVDAERRQLTVMFCDLVGSTALSARLDPEDLREVVAAYHRAVTEVVAGFDGFVAKYMGDGVLLYFGYPQAHEDDAERAIRAGLDVIDAVGRLDVKSAQLQARIGIATGLVVVGDLIGEGSAREQSVVGETPNLAARLQGLAEPNAVVIAAGTRRLVGDLFEYCDLGAVEVKGIAGPVPAWQVLRPSAVVSRFEALRGSALTRLVGRDEEIDFLLRRWGLAKAGDGQVVLVAGEPGIGKSRIAAALAERLQAEPHLRVRYFCSPYHQDSALYPFIDQLGWASGFARDDPPAVKLEKLEALLARAAPPDEDVAYLADLMSLPASERHPLPNLSPQRKKERTLEALLHQLEGLARRQPILMVFEDAHWIDPTSRELLDLTVERVRTLPVLLIVTFRPEFQPPWTGQSQVTMLALNRLDRHDRTALVSQIAVGKALPDEVVAQIAERTDGVPLFVEELTKSVIESGVAPLGIPTTLHDSLMARLDRLASARRVAQIGAAIGREFPYALLRAVSRLPEEELQTSLARLVGSELVSQRGTPPEAVYAFRHALVQDAAHGSLLRNSRQQLHAQIAAALETHSPEITDSQPELFAQHYEQAGLNEKAVEYWARAGRRSAAHSALVEAAIQIEKALARLALTPDGGERQQMELRLQADLGSIRFGVRGWAAPETGQSYARARDLWEQLGYPSEFLRVPWGQWMYHANRGDLHLGQRLAEDLLHRSHQQGQGSGLILARLCLGATLMGRGEFALSRLHLGEVDRLYIPATHQTLVQEAGVYPHTMGLTFLGFIHFCLGYPDQALAYFKAAMAEAWSEQHRLSIAQSLAMKARLLCLLGDVGLLAEHAEQLFAIGVEQGFPYWRAQGLIYRGWAKVAMGGIDDGISSLREGVVAYQATGARWWMPHFHALQADAEAIEGRPDVALDILIEALGTSRERGENWFEAELVRRRGQLVQDRDPMAAETLFEEAIGIAQRQGAKLWELRAAASLAGLRRDQGRHAEARDLLTPVYDWFTEGFDTPDLKEAKALLDELA
jgi:class 3 adenylate cyclase/predicted ATPase